jgi:hypothetical protein
VANQARRSDDDPMGLYPDPSGTVDRRRPPSRDELPTYKRTGMPNHAMDASLSPRDAAVRFAPGLANVRLGVLGY